MCTICNDPTHAAIPGSATPNPLAAAYRRRDLLKAGAGLAALPMMGRSAWADEAGIPSVGYVATSQTAPLARWEFTRRALAADDVLIDIQYAGVCHSDIHGVRADITGRGTYPFVPGHEIVGRVRAVGPSVRKHKVGDAVGVGCMVNSCGTCEYCKKGLEQYCVKFPTFTYGSPDGPGKYTNGGYANNIVVKEHFVLRIPKAMDLASAAPLLCAGITTFSPMERWKIGAQQKVAIVGLGGLGHMAVKLAVARNADVTVFTTTPGKLPDAKRLGAREAILWSDKDAFRRLGGSFDFVLTTVPRTFDVNPFINLLKVDGTIINLGLFEPISPNYAMVNAKRRSIAGSIIGGIEETQQVLDYCAARNIRPEVEMIPIQKVNEAYQNVVDKNVKFRYVIDMSTLT